MDDFVVIALFRHGLTEANKRHVYLGWTDSPLCKVEEVKRMSQSVLDYDLLFASDLGRCLDTARILFPHKRLERLPELREMHFGKWEGKTFEDLQHDIAYQKWLDDPFLIQPPDGESYADFSKRVEKGWQKIIERIIDLGVKRTAVVTHGGVIRYLLSRLAPKEKDFWDWKIPHTGGYELIWNRDGWRRGERCILLQEVPLTAKENGSRKPIN